MGNVAATLDSVIVVDGRTDEEKLLELLATGTEETELDFKATVDLSRGSKSALDFVKDAISMGNLPNGGYIVVGVDDRGKPAHNEQPVEVAQFDSAKLRARIAKYVDAPVHVVSQPHVVDDRDVVVVYVRPNESGLPVPIKAIGQFDEDGKGNMKTVFSEGEVLIREGTSNVRLRYAHWDGLLSRYRERIRAEARADIDQLIARLAAAQPNGRDQSRAVLLDVAMDDEALTAAIPAAFETGSPPALSRFLNAAAHVVAGESDVVMSKGRALDLIAATACQAALFDRHEEFAAAMDALWNAYQAVPVPGDGIQLQGRDADHAAHELEVILRVFAVGATVVRTRRWSMMRTIVDRPVPVAPHYTYGTWLRHALVQASRAGLLLDDDGRERGGQVLSLARRLIAESRLLRPDRGPAARVTVWEDLADDDWILNSLCQFDVVWCVLARALHRGKDSSGFYPSCAAFNQYRAQPALDLIVSDPDVRRDVFGSISDAQIAGAITTVLELAVGQSHQYGGWWGGVDESLTVAQFVADARGTSTS